MEKVAIENNSSGNRGKVACSSHLCVWQVMLPRRSFFALEYLWVESCSLEFAAVIFSSSLPLVNFWVFMAMEWINIPLSKLSFQFWRIQDRFLGNVNKATKAQSKCEIYAAKTFFVRVNEEQEGKGRPCAVLMSHYWGDGIVDEILVKFTDINKHR